MDRQYEYTGSRPSMLLGGEMSRHKTQQDFEDKLRTGVAVMIDRESRPNSLVRTISKLFRVGQ